MGPYELIRCRSQRSERMIIAYYLHVSWSSAGDGRRYFGIGDVIEPPLLPAPRNIGCYWSKRRQLFYSVLSIVLNIWLSASSTAYLFFTLLFFSSFFFHFRGILFHFSFLHPLSLLLCLRMFWGSINKGNRRGYTVIHTVFNLHASIRLFI